jgi:AGZA family xanthine/uracil permease-like MFS transporter
MASLPALYIREWSKRRKIMRTRLEQYFRFSELGTNWRTELLAGATTFLTMAYIVFVNPAILGAAGLPAPAVTAATCFCAALGSILMGTLGRYPIALAPGMGINAYFAYTVVKGMGVPWQTALGAVFLAGVLFLVLTALRVQQRIVAAVPLELHASVAAGIGLFLALIGLRNAGIVVPNPETTVALGNLREPNTLLALFGLLVIATLTAWGVRAAMLLGILATTALGALVGLTQWRPQPLDWGQITAAAGKLDIAAAMNTGLLEIVFVFYFVILFDNVGTLIGVAKKAGLLEPGDRLPRAGTMLGVAGTATVAGALTGTSPVVCYIESAAGVSAGGRTGVTAIVAGLLFLVALVAAPLAGAIPAAATAPALIVVGSLMVSTVAEIRWSDPVVATPAFLTMITIPLTSSIANGIAIGFIAFAALKTLRGRYREVHWLVYLLAALFVLRFAYLTSAH